MAADKTNDDEEDDDDNSSNDNKTVPQITLSATMNVPTPNTRPLAAQLAPRAWHVRTRGGRDGGRAAREQQQRAPVVERRLECVQLALLCLEEPGHVTLGLRTFVRRVAIVVVLRGRVDAERLHFQAALVAWINGWSSTTLACRRRTAGLW